MDEPTLEELREHIDRLDQQLLAQLARRDELVRQVAAAKERSGTPVRDREHERRVLERRRRSADELGLDPGLIEGLYRLILWGSRERQSRLIARPRETTRPVDVAIVGGAGQMGRLLARTFEAQGHRVQVADVDTELTPEEAVAAAQVALISVPISRTEELIQRVGPHLRADGLLMDVTSTKAGPMEAMLAATGAEVVGTHPLFGPSVHSLQGQRVVLVRGRGERWFAWVEELLRVSGLTTIEASAEEHDRIMAVVQVLTHFSTEVLGSTLAKLEVPLERTLEFTSPIYLLELLMTARHFAQSPELYASIQLANPDTEAVTGAFAEAVEGLRGAIGAGDRAEVTRVFEEVREYFGPFTERALEESSYLIDRLVERS